MAQPQPISPKAFSAASLDPANQPHLVSLVLQSKKALQHGEQLCTQARTASTASAQASVDVLALDAKVRWIGDAVLEQLKLAATVAKAIEEKRLHLDRQVNEWDTARAKHTDALDAILESLGSHLVPPDFHQTSAGSSLFGSQPSSPFLEPVDKAGDGNAHQPQLTKHTNSHSPQQNGTRLPPSPVSPSATLRRNGNVRAGPPVNANDRGPQKGTHRKERKHWKTLRDFVDDRAIEDALEVIENERVALDEILSRTDDYPETLTRAINSIQTGLPVPEQADVLGTTPMLKQIQQVITAQEGLITSMAHILETLASHYDQMAGALKDTEAGEMFTEEELQVMNRDTEELPAIMGELEEKTYAIDAYYQQLTTARDGLQKDLDYLAKILGELDELGEIMGEMLGMQDSVETQAEDDLNALHRHLSTLEQLHDRFISYRMAFNKLVLEIARRRQYREAAENIVIGMTRQLESMTGEESKVRAHFNAEYGLHLPEDLCLCVGNAPTRWEVVPYEGTAQEFLPVLENDLVVEARKKVGTTEGPLGTESL